MGDFLIAGAGAVGSGIGGMLARGGNRVTLLGREIHMEAVRREGLRIEGIWGTHRVRNIEAITLPEQMEHAPDYVLVTVKSFDTAAMIRAIAPRIGERAFVVSLQNGVGNAETISEVVGWERTLAGMVIIGFELPSPGVVRVTVQADAVKVGRLNGRIDQAVRDLAAAFRAAYIPCDAVENISAYLWAKVLYNAALNPLGAILQVPYGELTQPEPWRIIEGVVREAFLCLDAAGIKLFWEKPKEYLSYLHDYQIPATAAHRSSMLQDLMRGRRTEIDFINGAIVALGRRHGVATPLNEELVQKIKALEASARNPGADAEPLFQRG